MGDEVNLETLGHGFADQLSVLKSVGAAVALLVLAICPMLPGFSDGLRYTAFFYSPALYPVLVLSCLIAGALGLSLMAAAWRALTGIPAVEIWGENVRVRAIRDQSFALSAVKRVAWNYGNIAVQTTEGKRIAIPVWLLRNGRETLLQLEAAGLKIPAR